MSALIHPKTIKVDGLSVRYAEGGQDGPDAILMSPWPESVYAFEPAVSFSLRKISGHIMHSIDEPRPGLLVERLPLAPAGPSEGLDHVGQVAAPRLRRLIVAIDADQSETFGKLAAPDEIIECRRDKTLGQVARGAENHHGRRRRPAAGKAFCDRCRGLCRNGRCRRARVAMRCSALKKR